MYNWTDEEMKYLKQISYGRTQKETTIIMNKKFNTNLTFNQVRGRMRKLGITTGRDGRFKNGQTSWNKGNKGLKPYHKKCKFTWFKKGEMPHNVLKVGTESIREGYTVVKIVEPNVWEFKHRLVWEKHKGKIPNGAYIVFGDGNKQNFNIDNLICISNKQLLVLNTLNLIKNNADLTRTGVKIADLYSKIKELERRSKQ